MNCADIRDSPVRAKVKLRLSLCLKSLHSDIFAVPFEDTRNLIQPPPLRLFIDLVDATSLSRRYRTPNRQTWNSRKAH